jgi:hypothetical protein
LRPSGAAQRVDPPCCVNRGRHADADSVPARVDHNPHCILTTGRNSLDGLDIVVEGEARAVSDELELMRILATDPDAESEPSGRAMVRTYDSNQREPCVVQ